MKQEEKTEQTRQKIISAAIREFGENGYNKASLNRICERGIPKGLLYHNYKNKDDVYLSCLKQCCSDFLKAFERTGFPKDLQSYMAVRVAFFREHPLRSRVIFETVIRPDQSLNREITSVKKDFDQFNLQCFENIIDSTSLRKDVSREDAVTYFTICQSVFNVYFSTMTHEELSLSERVAEHEKMLEKTLDFMMYGIVQKGEL